MLHFSDLFPDSWWSCPSASEPRKQNLSYKRSFKKIKFQEKLQKNYFKQIKTNLLNTLTRNPGCFVNVNQLILEIEVYQKEHKGGRGRMSRVNHTKITLYKDDIYVVISWAFSWTVPELQQCAVCIVQIASFTRWLYLFKINKFYWWWKATVPTKEKKF